MSDDDRPLWDQAFSEALVSREIIVGLTHVSEASTWQEQMFGTVESVDRDKGIAIRLAGERSGDLYWLPPDLRSFQKAAPGEYRLRSTGEVVIDPDFTTTWTINHRPTSH